MMILTLCTAPLLLLLKRGRKPEGGAPVVE
jgi:hypothetical protein